MCTHSTPPAGSRLRQLRNRLLCGEAEALLRDALLLLNDAPRFRTRAGLDSYAVAGRIGRHLRGAPLDLPALPAPDPARFSIPALSEPVAGEVKLEGSHGWLIVARETGAVLRRGPACDCGDGCAAVDVPAGGAYGWLARVEPSSLPPAGENWADVVHVGVYDAAGTYEPPCAGCVECDSILFRAHCQNPACELYSPLPDAPEPAPAA